MEMESPNRNRLFSPALLRRFAVVTSVSWAMMTVYLVINRFQSGPHTIVEMPGWVPFWPAFILPYQALLLLAWLLPATLQDPGRFRACLRAYVYAFLLVMPWWILTPTLLPRPELPEGIWRMAFETIWKLDRPVNVAPCAHAIGPIVAGWFAAQEYPKWRWPMVVFLALTLPSIALVWQHRPVDILLGGVAAGLGVVLAQALGKRESRTDRPKVAERALPLERVS